MEVNAPKRLSVHERLGGRASNSNVGAYWAAGRCNTKNSKYFRPQDSQRKNPNIHGHKFSRNSLVWKREQHKASNNDNEKVKKSFESEREWSKAIETGTNKRKKSNERVQRKVTDTGLNNVEESVKKEQKDATEIDSNGDIQSTKKVCKFWAAGNCVKGDCCPYLHSWFCGDDITMLAKLQGHQKGVTGIVLPSGSNKLYSRSKDEGIRVWDCHTGQCTCTIPLDVEVGCLLNEDSWLFVGMPNVVKAWNMQSNVDFSLNGPVGQVYSLAVYNGMLLAGTQDGTILVWKGGFEANPFQPLASLKGHSQAIVSLIIGANRLYSGSADHTIRVWDLDTLQCIMTLNEHSDTVMSLICWDQYLLSGSLDGTIKIWAATESGSLEMVYKHKEEHGVLALGGMTDSEGKHILMCSCNDNSLRLYELPSFIEMGRLFAKEEICTIQTAPGGLIFTGDGTGLVSVWKWAAQPRTQTQGC